MKSLTEGVQKMQITRKNLNEFRNDVVEALQPILDEYELTLEKTPISYNDIEFTIKLQIKNGKLDKDELAKKNWKRDCFYFPGVTEEDFGKEFSAFGESFKAVALKPRARKYPLIGLSLANGRRYKLPKSCLDKIIVN